MDLNKINEWKYTHIVPFDQTEHSDVEKYFNKFIEWSGVELTNVNLVKESSEAYWNNGAQLGKWRFKFKSAVNTVVCRNCDEEHCYCGCEDYGEKVINRHIEFSINGVPTYCGEAIIGSEVDEFLDSPFEVQRFIMELLLARQSTITIYHQKSVDEESEIQNRFKFLCRKLGLTVRTEKYFNAKSGNHTFACRASLFRTDEERTAEHIGKFKQAIKDRKKELEAEQHRRDEEKRLKKAAEEAYMKVISLPQPAEAYHPMFTPGWENENDSLLSPIVAGPIWGTLLSPTAFSYSNTIHTITPENESGEEEFVDPAQLPLFDAYGVEVVDRVLRPSTYDYVPIHQGNTNPDSSGISYGEFVQRAHEPSPPPEDEFPF